VFVVSGTALPPPILSGLLPVRTVIGDTLQIDGSGFTDRQGEARVLFGGASGGEVEAGNAVDWSSTSVRVIVPAGAGSGHVVVRTAGGDSNGLLFEVAPRLVSYAADVDPLFGAPNGCRGCHGGSGGLFVDSHASLMRGDSNNGPVVLSRRSAASPLVQKLLPSPPFGQRMPIAGTPLPAADIQIIADWIDQGARDN
jgi:hypothetical protein